ncbi:MAG: CaiB/BaiF CoA transferase family protein [Granulosicoccus sp.]
MDNKPDALAALRVLDLTRVRAGPNCCRVLADFGADVIKIEAPPGVDPNEGMSGARHGYDMLNLHRNKRSLTLNLKKAEGLELFRKMVKNSDIVVENFRPDVKDRLCIDYESLSKINPRIILASISGFGQDGPYEKRAGFDQIAQGMGGLMGVTGDAGAGPMRAGTAVADSTAGLYAAVGILIAVQERQQSGKGQWIQTSLLQAQIALMDFQAARYLVDKEVPKQAGNNHPYSTPCGVAKTADGYINVATAGEQQWANLCQALGHEEWIEKKEFTTGDARLQHRDQLWELLNSEFTKQSSTYWVEKLEKYGVPAGPIYTMDEVFDDPQVKHLGIAQTVEHYARGTVSLVGQPLKLSRTPSNMTRAAPDAGEHTDEILADMEFTADEIAELKCKGVV